MSKPSMSPGELPPTRTLPALGMTLLALGLMLAACGRLTGFGLALEPAGDHGAHAEHAAPAVAGEAQTEGTAHTAEHAASAATAGADEHTDHMSPAFGIGGGPSPYNHHGQRKVELLYQQASEAGVSVEFTIVNHIGGAGRAGEISSDIRAGEAARATFRITDATTGKELSGLQPAVWMDLWPPAEGGTLDKEAACEAKIQGYLGGQLTERPLVDLNGYYLLALNQTPSISVIDPMVNLAGKTQLFSSINLPSPGADWAMGPDSRLLFVSLPAAGQVAVASTERFAVERLLDVGGQPGIVALQPGGAYLWVGDDSAAGVLTAIEPATGTIAGRVTTGGSHSALVFSSDGRRLYAASSATGKLVLVDTAALKVVREAPFGRGAVAVQPVADGALYAGDPASGTISVLDPATLEPRSFLATAPGLAAIGFAPGGRWAIATSPLAGKAFVIDAARGAVTAAVPVTGAPDQITFSAGAAYLRSSQTAAVSAIRLADLGQSAPSVSALVPGRAAAGPLPFRPLAGATAAAEARGAVMLASPAEDKIYYYLEDGQAPAGSFKGYSMFPRDVLTVNRSISEEAPGIYSGNTTVPASGDFMVAFLLPQGMRHCFSFSAAPPADAAQQAMVAPLVQLIAPELALRAGQPASLHFHLIDPENGKPIVTAGEVTVMVTSVTGGWRAQQAARVAADGAYTIVVAPPAGGVYRLFFAVPSLRLGYQQMPDLFVKVQ